MADIQNKIKEAKQSGYTNEEIFSHVSKLPEYQSKIKEALDAKYSPDEILVHLSGDPSFAAPQARANVGAEEPSTLEKLKSVAKGYGQYQLEQLAGEVLGMAAPLKLLCRMSDQVTNGGCLSKQYALKVLNLLKLPKSWVK